MADRYLIKYAIGRDEYPIEPVSTEQEALARVRELFIKHGQKSVNVEIHLNHLGTVLYGARILKKWNRGEAKLE
jgi:hypothetical protein